MKLSQASNIVYKAINFALDQKDARNDEYVVPYLVGAAGLGKTAMIKDVAKKIGADRDVECHVQELRLTERSPEEIAGWLIPNDDKSRMVHVAPDWMRKMTPNSYGILFLDELPQAVTMCQNVSAQICNERAVGSWKIPDGWAIIAAGNRMSDRAGTNNMPSHLKDRLMFLPVEADLEDTMAYANLVGWSEQIKAFLRFRPSRLHEFKVDQDSCPSPRTWGKVNSVLKWGLDPVEQIDAIAGNIGQAATAEFVGFLKVYDVIPDIDELIANPSSAVISDAPDVQYAVCAALSSKLTGKNAKNIVTYLKRLPEQELAAFVIKDAMSRSEDLKRELTRDDAVREWILSIGKHLVL